MIGLGKYMFSRNFALLIFLTQTAWCQIKIQSVVNAASYSSGLPSGGLATVFVTGLTTAPGLYVAPTFWPLPTQLAGVVVRVDQVPAPILAIYVPPNASTSGAQINFQVPWDWNRTAAISPSTLTVGQGEIGPYDQLTPIPVSRGGFYSDQNGFAAAQHGDFTTVTTLNPAHAGETLTVYADDFFSTYPPPPIGYPTPPQPLFIGGLSANLYLQFRPLKDAANPNGDNCPVSDPIKVTFLGLGPGLVGTEQINFVIPANQSPGDLYLFFAVPLSPSNPIGIGSCTYTVADHSNQVKIPVR
jgi:uncharacterized protein (TIGR03437 family)